MKNFFNVTYKNSSKPFAYFVILLIVIAIIAGIAGCGEDNGVNNGNVSAFPVYSIDSLVLRSMDIGSTDTTFDRNFIADLDSFKIQFTLETNVPNSFTSLQLNIADSNTSLLSYTFSEGDLNESYINLMYSAYGNCTKYINAIFTLNGNGNLDKYLILRNFKVYRLS